MSALREAAQQALEALYEETAWFGPTPKGAAAITALRAALAQEQDPEPVPHQHEWFRVGGWEPGRIRCIHCGKWGKETFDD